MDRSAHAILPSQLRRFVPVDSDTATEQRLTCTECGQLSQPGADGWRAYVAFIPEDGEAPETLVFCPDCAEFEFDAGA
jgi:hypothetical protein